MIISYILAAGKQSRFKSETPKGLMPFSENQTVLDINIENSLKFSDEVIIVTSSDNYKIYYDYITKKNYNNQVKVIRFEENLGSGHSVYNALELKNPNKNMYETNIFIMWADSIQSDENLFKICIDNLQYGLVVPCRMEDDPYTNISVDENMMITGCKFKKHGETDGSRGYHDLSLFYGSINYIHTYLEALCYELYTLIEKHGDMEFLDILNICKSAKVIEYNTDKIYSFNTIEEFNNINNG